MSIDLETAKDIYSEGLMSAGRLYEKKLTYLKSVLERIRSIPLGPDRGSAQSQIDCAVQYATDALKETK